MTYPLSFRLYNQVNISPIILCLIMMIALAGCYVLLANQTDFFDNIIAGVIPSIEFRATFTVLLLIAYVPMAQYYLIKWSQEHWLLIAKSVNDMPTFNYSLSRFWGLLGMGIQTLSFFGVSLFRGDIFNYSYWNLRLIFSYIFVIAIGWHLYRFLTSLVLYAKQFSKIAKSLPPLELYDTALPRVFVQQGIRSALLIVGFVSICGNLIVAPGTRIDVAIAIASVSTLCAVMVLIYPVVGIHRRIHEAKQKRLVALHLQIEPLTKSINDDHTDWQKLSTLLALESRVQAVREWPFDASSISRFIFYIAIGLSSWIGAALVEKLLDSML